MTFYRIIKQLRKIVSRLFLIAVLLSLSILLYIFYQSEINLYDIHLVNPFYELIHSFPLWVYLVFCFTILSIISITIFIGSSLYYTITQERYVVAKEKYYNSFAVSLSHFFLSDSSNKEALCREFSQKNKHVTKKRIQILAFFEVYLKIQETLAVNLSSDFKLLINDLKLQRSIVSLIRSSNFDDKILAMKILSYLRMHTCDKAILRFARSKNFALRTEAYASLIRLMEKDEHLVDFIGERHTLSMLDMNIIVNAVLKNFKMNIDYSALLSSNSFQKNMAGLILAKYRFRNNERNVALILNHIENPNTDIRKCAWDALLSIVDNETAVDLITKRFSSETEEIKLLILQKTKEMISTRLVDFLTGIIYQQPLLVKISALKIIFENDFNVLSSFEFTEDVELRNAFKEVSCVYSNL